MCGIAGIVASRPPGAEPLAQMVGAMRHRGPDDSGCLTVGSSPWVQLGNTRLAILDLSSAGHQPMRDPSTGNAVVLNGEIYNHPEVRREIGDRAGRWHSSSDTETVLKAWTLWGPTCLPRLRGMFAIAFWDQAEQALWCARDRLGIKPLYFYESDGLFVFASEVRALLASGLVPQRLDPVGLSGFVRFGSVVEPNTMIEGVKSLPAGQYIRVQKGEVGTSQSYWKPDQEMDAASHQDAATAVRAHLERSVREHLLADVPVGCFLSGGVDSSVVTALAAQNSSRPIRTFTVAFPNTGIDDSSYAAAVADRYDTEHYPIVLTTDELVGMVPDAVRAMDLPTADGVNTYIVSEAAASTGTRVVLSGLGGDELFAGYPLFRALDKAQRFTSVAGPFSGLLASVLGLRDGAAERLAEVVRPGRTLLERHDSFRSYWSLHECEEMGVGRPAGSSIDARGSGLSVASRVSVLEMTGYMRSTLLRDGDSMSMAHSLEMRLPFLDHLLVEYSLRSGAATCGVKRRPKEVLLAAVGDLLPQRVIRRRKHGFILPMAEWMRGPLRNFVADGMHSLAARQVLPMVDFDNLQHRFDAGNVSWARLWQFVVLGHWLDNLQ